MPRPIDNARRRCELDDCFADLDAAARQAQLMVFCTPVDQIAEQVVAAASCCQPGTLLTDVGSTKAVIVRDVERRLSGRSRFIGSHPLAGSEKCGAGHAQPRLFENRVVVVTPTDKSDPTAHQEIRAFWQALGAHVIDMTPEDHDAALARTSHLPHLVAAALARGLPEKLRELTATGFRNMTRLAAGDASMWTGIFFQNRGPVLQALAEFEEELHRFRAAIEAADRTAIDSLLTQAKRNRDALGS